MLSRRQGNLELLDERSDVLVADYGALPFLDTKDGFVDLEVEILFYLNLATQTPMILLLFAGEVNSLGRQNLTAPLKHLALALSARTFATAGGRQVHTGFAQRGQQGAARRDGVLLITVDGNFDIATGYQILLGNQQDNH